MENRPFSIVEAANNEKSKDFSRLLLNYKL